MREKSFELLVKTEQSASSFLKKLCWENYRRFCIRCRSYRLYRIAGEKYRCKRCGYTFHDFSGRWINKCRISSQNWLGIIKLFEQEFSIRQIAEEVALSYPTVLKALEVLRFAIITNSADSESWLDCVYSRSREPEDILKSHKMIAVFGIKEQHGKVRIEILRGLPLKTVLALKSKTLRRSSICYTNECRPYEALIFLDQVYDQPSVKGDDSNLIYKANGESDFWRYAKKKIIKYRGISKAKFPQYLKEIEFRYNHRDQPIFYLLCQYLVSFIPA